MTATTSQDHAPPQVLHYAPGDRPLCGADSWTEVYSDDPGQVAGCEDCLELVSEDLQDHHEYRGHCLHCRQVDLCPRAEFCGGGQSGAPASTAAARAGEQGKQPWQRTLRFPRPSSWPLS